MKLRKTLAKLGLTVLPLAALMMSQNATAEIDGSSPAICGHGCWVWIYADDDFDGANDILCGPFKRTNMVKLPNAGTIDWSEEVNSLKVGPNATLRIWEDAAFEGYSKFYSSGTVKSDFDDDGDVEQANSIELICLK